MGADSALSTDLCYHEPLSIEINFCNFDPTIILRLHSILSGTDIFHLTERYDYNIFKGKQRVITMVIPEDLKNLLLKINDSSREQILKSWHSSQEVNLCNWTETQTEIYLFALTESCKKSADHVKINMHLDKKPPFCA
ncbi:MAG: hypothetical protein NE328_20045 [Lentisphaeraceae bacterium]|nr:hypothetical protein [Lentisphaeraceae bacterium]